MKVRSPARAIVMIGAAALSVGCYRYVSAEPEAVPLGGDVRVHLTRGNGGDFVDVPDAYAPNVTGQLISREADGLLIRVPVGSRQLGFHTTRIGQDLRISTADILSLEQRHMDRVGTGLFIAGVAAGAAAVVFLVIEAAGGMEPPDVPAPPEMRSPLLSIPVR